MTNEEYTKLGQSAAEQLLGTCKGVHDLGEKYERALEKSVVFCNALDDGAMLCGACGWWVEPHEIDPYERCEDCQ